MKTVAVIPVKGRLPLLKYTIQRLYKKNGVFEVICIGDSIEEQEVCENEGAEFIFHENNPLGKKWNAGFLAAKKHNPDAVLFVGSSDWVSNNWLSYTEKLIRAGADLVGKPDFYLLDIGETYRFCHWLGYTQPQRRLEPIGIGRVISKRILDLMNWQPIQETLNNSIDWSMYQNILKLGGEVKNVRTNEIQSLSISTSHWANMHKFEDHYRNKKGLEYSRFPGFEKWLDEKFPEYKMIFNEDRAMLHI